MSNLDELAKKYNAFVKSDRKGFRRRARILQSIWRTEREYPMGEHKGRPLGSRLAVSWAEKHLSNYLNDAIGKIAWQEVDEKKITGKLYKEPQMNFCTVRVKAFPESESGVMRSFFVAGGVSSLRTSWPAGLFVPAEIFLRYQA
jgi:hypothetical protein